MFEGESGSDNSSKVITRRGLFEKAKKGAKLVVAAVILPKLESAIGPIEAEKKEYIERIAILLEDPHFSGAELLPTTAEEEDNPGKIQVHKLETENGKLFRIEIPFSTFLNKTEENKEKSSSQGIANAVWITYARRSASYQFSLGGKDPQDTEKLVRVCQIFSGEEKEGLTFYLPEEKDKELASKKYDNVIYPNDPHSEEPITSLNILLMRTTPVISRHYDEPTGKYKFLAQNVSESVAKYTVNLDHPQSEDAKQN